MSYKLIGAAVLILSSAVFALDKNASERRRIEKCKAVLDFICECKLQMECFSLPLPLILDGCKEKWKEGAVFLNSAKKDGLEMAAKSFSSELLSGEEERDIFISFASAFGRGDVAAEAARCAEGIEKMKLLIEKLEKNVVSDGKMRLTVCICSALMAVLFFA